MNKKIVLSTLILLFLMFATVMKVSAQRTVGVSSGDSFRYSESVSWSSNDPNAKPDPTLIDENNTQWIQIYVTSVSGTNITFQMTGHYKNGTEVGFGGWEDIRTGNGVNSSAFFISANLDIGESVFDGVSSIINETVSRTYIGGGARDTNHFNASSSSENQTLNMNYYWDKLTGALVELQFETVNQTGTYTTTSLVDSQIIYTDLWTVPEFPNWTLTLIMLASLTPIILALSKRRQLKTLIH